MPCDSPVHSRLSGLVKTCGSAAALCAAAIALVPVTPLAPAFGASATGGIVLVRGTATEAVDPTGEGPGSLRAALLVGEALRRAGVPFDEIGDEDVAAGSLSDKALAVFPYNPKLAEGEREAIGAFTRGGGKLIVFYSLDRSLHEEVGIASCTLRSRSRRGEFAEMRFVPDALPFAPVSMLQDSWNILEVTPTPAARVIARWHDDAGRPVPSSARGGETGTPAIVSGPSGIFVTHIMLGPAAESKARAMLAAAAELAGPAALESATEFRLSSARSISAWEGLGGLAELARALEDPRADRRALVATLNEAAKAEQQARAALELGAYAEAYRQALSAEHNAREAASRALPARDGEIRAVWVRYPETVDWPQVAPRLAAAGINTVLPNYIRGMTASYPSSAIFSRPGDTAVGSLVSCIQACRRSGLEVHVWWTVLFLDDTPADRADELAAQKRLIVNAGGEIHRAAGSPWLCPSNRANVQLASAIARELVERYRPDGIHIDYLRMPMERSCFCDVCRAGFSYAKDWPEDVLPGGKLANQYRSYRRKTVTDYVGAIVESARAVSPNAFVSAAVYPESAVCRQTIAQDWVDWADRGLLDFVVPMNYTDRPEDLARWVGEQSQRLDGKIPLVSGLGVAAGRVGIEDPAELIRQIAVSRAAGADGFAIFQLDTEFMELHLPAIAAGPGRTGASIRPFGAPRLAWSLPTGPARDAIPAGRTIEILLATGSRLPSGLGVQSFGLAQEDGSQWPRVELESASGRLLSDLGPGPAPGSQVRIPVVVPEGPFRIVVRGRVTAPPRAARIVAMRSPLFTGLTESDLAAERARTAPTGSGPRVAVLDGGYGSRGILAWLRRTGTYSAYPIQTLEALGGSSSRPGVLVLTQRRDPGEIDGAARAALRLFVEAGGAVLMTHDACGYRYHPVLFPEVAWGTGHEREAIVFADEASPLANRLGSDPIPHQHYDHVLLTLGGFGRAVARTERGIVVACGASGRGRLVACGIALGIDGDEREHQPRGREAVLLEALMAYLVRADEEAGAE